MRQLYYYSAARSSHVPGTQYIIQYKTTYKYRFVERPSFFRFTHLLLRYSAFQTAERARIPETGLL